MALPDRATSGLTAKGRKFERLGIVIGAMKAGTTSVYHALSAHPQIAASTPKETDFFKTAEAHDKGLDAYETYFPFDPARHVIAFEASPNYAKSPQYPGAAERLAASPYDLRLIYVLRHPIQRYISHYIHSVARRWGIRDIHRDIDPNALSASSYASQLAAFAAAGIPRDKILLVRFDDLVKNPLPQLERMTAHLGVAHANWDKFPHSHASAQHYLAMAVETLRSEGAKENGNYNAPIVRPDGKIDLRETFIPASVPPRLHAALRDDMRRLHEEWGFDVKPWGF